MKRTRDPSVRPRNVAMWLHRWVALVLGAWFVLLGLTGSLLAWRNDIDRALNPGWFAPLAACSARTEAPIATSLAVYTRSVPGGKATQVMAPLTPGAAYIVWDKPDADGLRRQHFVDASCQRYLGQRAWGARTFDRAHVVPAIYELHRSLLLREAGHVGVGYAGLVMLFVVITGAWVAFPRRRTRDAWKRALTVKPGASRHLLFFSLHRAGGLWLALYLALMCLTGAYLCFPKQATALVSWVLPMSSGKSGDSHVVAGAAKIDPDTLVRRAQAAWPDARWTRMQFPAKANAPYEVRLLQRAELRANTGDTRVRMAGDGSVLESRDPLKGPGGDRLISWLFPFHSAEMFGIPGRVLWSMLGFAPLLFFATGTWLWWRKRSGVDRPVSQSVQGFTSDRT